jgi:hypothetical protein
MIGLGQPNEDEDPAVLADLEALLADVETTGAAGFENPIVMGLKKPVESKPEEPVIPKAPEPVAAIVPPEPKIEPKIELKLESKPEPKPEPMAVSKPVVIAAPPPPSQSVPASSSRPLEGLGQGVPEKAPKDRIRRIALVFGPGLDQAKDFFIQFLEKSAPGVSKSPLFLRKVLCEEIVPGFDCPSFVERLRQVGAVAVLAVFKEDFPEAELLRLQESLSTAGLLIRFVDPSEIQRRSIAVDIIVDLMPLSGE